MVAADPSRSPVKIGFEDVRYSYAGVEVLRGVTFEVPDRVVTVLFGPAGGGKTTLMRLANRLNDLVDGTRLSGRVLLDGEDVYAPGADVQRLRRRVGMVKPWFGPVNLVNSY